MSGNGDGVLKRVRERVYEIHETSVRAHQLQESLAEFRRDMGERVAYVTGVVEHTQQQAGEALSSVNETRSRTLHEIDLMRMALGRMEARQLRFANCTDWDANAFRVYSQFGEDGLIQLLVREIGIPRALQRFVEFGVEDYQEANTRFLLLQDRWSGFVMDGSDQNMESLRQDKAFQRRDLRAAAAFVTRENIDDLLRENNFTGEIGLLSVDIDGNDYWIWEAITSVDPIIVITEYNYRFGPDIAAVVPYAPAFVKEEAHPSAIYYGASLKALCDLADRKGYAFVGCSDGGVNAFFVRRDKLPASIPARTAREGFVYGQHHEMRGAGGGDVITAGFEEQHALLMSLPLVKIGDSAERVGS